MRACASFTSRAQQLGTACDVASPDAVYAARLRPRETRGVEPIAAVIHHVALERGRLCTNIASESGSQHAPYLGIDIMRTARQKNTPQ